ncbi:MAG: FHA domain-containing protein, partial [Candidatus Binataceae bacterium]
MGAVVNRRDLIFKSLAGLAGGAIGWIPVEIASHGHSLTQQQTTAGILASFVSMAILSGAIGALIIAAEGQTLTMTPRVQHALIRGFIICFLLSLPAIYLSNVAFSAILGAGGWSVNHQGAFVYLFAARIIGWALMGLMLGAGVGLASFSLRNIVKGAIGGWVGGFIGGLVFDPISMAAGGGLLSRLVATCVVGLAIGLFIGLVQELTKSAWLVVEKGRLSGRQFRLEKQKITLGRAEENVVGLFGDPSVQPRHAVLTRDGASYMIKNLAVQNGTLVNGRRIETQLLNDGDTIMIGDYEMTF